MKKLLLVILISCSALLAEAQPYFALHSTDSISYLSSFQEAIDNSVDSDTIYIPGGLHYIGTVNIDKKLFIYGVGYLPDSSAATYISDLSGSLRILTGADGGLLSGVRVAGNVVFGTSISNQTVNDYTISRCRIVSYLYLSYNGTSKTSSNNIKINETIVTNDFYGGYIENCCITKCVLSSRVHYFDKCIFHNNVFVYAGINNSNSAYYDDQIFYYVSNSFFENNIILQAYNYLFGTGNYNINNGFYNNVFRIPVIFPINSNYGENNLVGFNASGMFVNVPSLNSYSDANDYHIVDGNAAKNTGTDLTDPGIFGTAYPFKHVPAIPHIVSKNIDRQLSEDGSLNVTVNVRAEDY